jgi:hypothetical protein
MAEGRQGGAGVHGQVFGIFTRHRDADILERHYLHREQRAEGLASIERSHERERPARVTP